TFCATDPNASPLWNCFGEFCFKRQERSDRTPGAKLRLGLWKLPRHFVQLSHLTMEKTYDLIIIGGGPIGLACGIEAKKAGLDYLILEKGALTNSIYNYPVNMTFFSTSDRLEMADIPFMSIGVKPTRTEALEYYRRIFFHFDLKVNLYEAVQTLEKAEDGFRIKTSKGEYACRKIVLATGFYDLPNLMNVPGENLPKVLHYYKEPWPFINQKVLVVGGANSAVDAALECWRKGAEVSM